MRLLIIIGILAVITLTSCERSLSGRVPDLHFSEDTILFDTVFTSLGSATKELRIINNDSRKIHLNRIWVNGGKASMFRLNIDGEATSDIAGVEIEGGDSLFIFIDVNVDPANSNSPVTISDSILFSVHEKIFKVQLLAWGQDIYLINNKIIKTETWVRGKPYVIYGNLTVDTLETLLIEKGTRIYFHRNASLTLAGSLIVNGTKDYPVLFSGDRLEKMYEDIPGQWLGIHLLNTSTGNNLNHAIIRNTVTAIVIGEAVYRYGTPFLKIFSTQITHSTVSAISTLNGSVEAANSIFSHCGSYCVYLSAGGEYSFTHCTIFNRWEYGLRVLPALHISEKSDFPGVRMSQIKVNFYNCAIFGDNSSEITIIPISSKYSGYYYFDHCLIKLDTLTASFWKKDIFPSVVLNKNPLFIDQNMFDFRPDSLSPVIDMGSTFYSAEYPNDIRGVSRIRDGRPDIGAFERVAGEHKDKM